MNCSYIYTLSIASTNINLNDLFEELYPQVHFLLSNSTVLFVQLQKFKKYNTKIVYFPNGKTISILVSPIISQ